jgi:membrane protease YdiL (CAAX protease family)
MTSSTTSAEPSSGPASARIGRALAAWLAIAAIQIALAFGASSDASDPADTPFYHYGFTAASVVIYGILIGLTFWIGSAYPESRRALGLVRFRPRWLGAAAGVVIASSALAAALEPVLHAGDEQGLAPDAWESSRAVPFAINALIAATLVPFAEELFFRGAGVTVLRPFGVATALLGTSVIFGLAHGLLVGLPVLVVLALGLAWVRYRSESVWPSVIAHGAYNGIAVIAVYVSLQ